MNSFSNQDHANAITLIIIINLHHTQAFEVTELVDNLAHSVPWLTVYQVEWWCRLITIILVTALDPFFRPLNTITSAILNTNRFGCRLYLGIFILFYSTNYTIQLYYLRIIYLARVLFLLPFAICASCKFGGKREKRCQRKCQNRRREDKREVRGQWEQKMIAIFWRRK